MRQWMALMVAGLFVVPVAGQSTPAKDVADIKATLVAMWDAIEKGDVDRYATYVHPAFTSFGENDTYITEGKDAEVRNYRDYLHRATGVHTDMHQPVVTGPWRRRVDHLLLDRLGAQRRQALHLTGQVHAHLRA